MRNGAELFEAVRRGMGGWTVERLDLELDFAALVAQLARAALYVAQSGTLALASLPFLGRGSVLVDIGWPERSSILGNLSAHADGERRGPDRVGG